MLGAKRNSGRHLSITMRDGTEGQTDEEESGPRKERERNLQWRPPVSLPSSAASAPFPLTSPHAAGPVPSPPSPTPLPSPACCFQRVRRASWTFASLAGSARIVRPDTVPSLCM
jgi:hypothetical protein